MLAEINDPPETVYEAPDVFNPSLHPPPGAIDVLNIVEAGVDFRSVLNPDYTDLYKKPTFANPLKVPSVGKGIELVTKAGDARCDGSVDSWCGRSRDEKCLLSHHNDGRNGLLFNSYSGWIVMNLPDVKNGIIVVKIESWHKEQDMSRTVGWTSINNERRRLGSVDASDNSNSSTPSFQHRRTDSCEEDFRFEYAIDGEVKSLDGEEKDQITKEPQRVVELTTLLNDPEYTGGEEREVEVAIRITGCQREKVYKLNHIYWS